MLIINGSKAYMKPEGKLKFPQAEPINLSMSSDRTLRIPKFKAVTI